MIRNTTRSRGAAAEVLGETLEHHAVVTPPRHQAEGAGADRAVAKAVAQALDLLARHDGRRVVGHRWRNGANGFSRRELDGELVHDPQARDLGRPAPDEVGRPRDLLEHPGPLPPGGALEGELHVGRRERSAVVEPHTRAEPEGVDAIVGRDRPALGHARPGCSRSSSSRRVSKS